MSVLVPQLQVSINQEPSISVYLGESLTLECQVTPPESLNGVVSSITWEYGDSNLSEGVTNMLSEGTSSLDLDTVVSAEAGVYTCSVQVTSPYLDIDPYLSANSTATVFVESKLLCVHVSVCLYVCMCLILYVCIIIIIIMYMYTHTCT